MPNQVAYGLDVPFEADSVASPDVEYGEAMTAIHFITRDGRWGRVTFERLDSLRVSRGEYDPYPESPDDSRYHWVQTVAESEWLKERYEYEKRHYGDSYNFNGDVDEMLTEYLHYVFSFHDEFVEVLAAGIWFESADAKLAEHELNTDHPLLGLRDVEATETLEGSGITCQVRVNPLPREELKRNARLCSQTVLEIAAELDGRASTDWTLTYRMRDGVERSYLRSYFGNAVECFTGIPERTAIEPTIQQWLTEVRERRRKMGKS